MKPDERRCLWCCRIQSQHPDMVFASADRWCKCSICLTGKSGRRGDTMTLPGSGAFVTVRRKGLKTPRPPKGSE